MCFINTIKKYVMQSSRTNKLEHFYSLCERGNILDVGVSGKARVAGENVFLETFRFPGEYYTGLGVEDLSELQKEYPDKRLMTYPGDYFPFPDKSFDWVFSNAVIEHVGDDTAQLRFVNEMLRVGKHVFFTTPNKYFPVESHTNALFLHWLPGDIFYRWCQKYDNYWTQKNLYLFSYSRLNDLMKESNARHFAIQSNRLLGWPMTFTVVCRL
jgi:SAM-dependent methyltransferase